MRKNLGLMAAVIAVAGYLSMGSAVMAKDFSVAIVDVPQVVNASAQVQALKKDQQAKAEEIVKFVEKARKDVASITDANKKKAAEIPYGAIIKTAISISPVVRNNVNGRYLNIPSKIPATSTKNKTASTLSLRLCSNVTEM